MTLPPPPDLDELARSLHASQELRLLVCQAPGLFQEPRRRIILGPDGPLEVTSHGDGRVSVRDLSPPPPPLERDPGYDTGAWVRRDAQGRTLRRVWRELDTAAARWAAPWWALTWLLTFGRQGRLPWTWAPADGELAPRPCRLFHRWRPHTVHFPGVPVRLDTVRCTRCGYINGLDLLPRTGNTGTR